MGFLLALLLKPVLAALFLAGPYLLAVFVWRKLPDGRVKRLLFTSWGEDRGPWMYVPWQRKKSRAYLPTDAA